MVDGFVGNLFSYIASRNGTFNRLFGKQYGTVCSSVLLLRISNIEINTAIYNKDTLNNIIYSDKKLSIKLKAIYGEGMSPLQYIQMIQLCT